MNAFIVMVVGLMIGSFLNVCIYRIPKKESIVYPGSHCTGCGHSLKALDLVPVFSYLFLKGRCRYCGEVISPRYMLVELVNAFFYLALYFYKGITLEFVIYAFFVSLLIVLTIIDIDYMIVPTSLIYFGIGVGVCLKVGQAFYHKDMGLLGNALLGGIIGFGVFYLVCYLGKWLFKKECLGFGDVRLMGMIGLYSTLNLLFIVIFLASILASVYGILMFYKNKRSEAFPFAPFINGAALISIFYGYPILEWYSGLLGM